MRREERSGRFEDFLVPSKQKQAGRKRQQSSQDPTQGKSHTVDIVFITMNSSVSVKRGLPILGAPALCKLWLVMPWHEMNVNRNNNGLSVFTPLQVRKLASAQHPWLKS